MKGINVILVIFVFLLIIVVLFSYFYYQKQLREEKEKQLAILAQKTGEDEPGLVKKWLPLVIGFI